MRAISAFALIFIFMLSQLSWAQQGKFKVAATVFPIADLVQCVGGDDVEAISVVPAGANPHVFEMNPGRVREFRDVRGIFTVGHHFDHWLETSYEALEGAEKIAAGEGVSLIGNGDVNPHYWLSVRNAKAISHHAMVELSRLHPKSQKKYEHNLIACLKKLDATGKEIFTLLKDLPTRKIMTTHGAFVYFARDFDLKVVGTLDHGHGIGPTPRHLMALTKTVRAENVNALFIETTTSREVAEPFAEDLNLTLYELDPMGGVEGRMNYHELMIHNAKVIREALQRG